MLLHVIVMQQHLLVLILVVFVRNNAIVGVVQALNPVKLSSQTGGHMLILKPNCELCDKDLPANAADAMICSYECSFCANCVENKLFNTCPNCGGGFEKRPIRPSKAWRNETSLSQQPASTKRVNTGYTYDEISSFIETIKDISPKKR